MRSNWSAERLLALLAAVSLEGAWLTLVYLIVSWLGHAHDSGLGITHFATAAGVGLLTARALLRRSQRTYGTVISAIAIVAAVIGSWLSGGGLEPARSVSGWDAVVAALGHPAGWLLGIGVLRGTAHAEPDDEGRVAEFVLNLGIPGLVAFWIFASSTGLAVTPTFAGPAFGATLTFVSAGLFAIGLARLVELAVESIDRNARRRWIWLLLGVTGAVWVLGLPLSALLRVPMETALVAAFGPVAPILGVVLWLVALPFGLLLEALAALLRPLGALFGNHLPAPTPGLFASAAAHLPTAAAPNLIWMLWIIGGLAIIGLLLGLAAFLRRPSSSTAAIGEEEVRTSEPIDIELPRLPHLHLPRWQGVPRNAVEAYLQTLAALARRDERRRASETPREHATRIARSEVGPRVGRLAVDYQLRVFGDRQLTQREEKQAVIRWRSVTKRR